MTDATHPPVAEALRQMRRLQSALLTEQQRMSTASFTGTDIEGTVEVTLDWRHWLTGLRIEDGLLRLGTEILEQRISDALRDAEATALASAEADQQRLIASVTDIAEELRKGLGVTTPLSTS